MNSTKNYNPTDLLPIKEIAELLSLEYGYLYKWSLEKGEIKPYFRGVWKLSLEDVNNFLVRKTCEKLRGTYKWQE